MQNTDNRTDAQAQHEIRLGTWQNVLSDVECDALIFDAPYGERVHLGHNSAVAQGLMGAGAREIGYPFLTEEDVDEVVDHWAPRTRGWICSLTSHDLVPAWERALQRANRYVFIPIPVIDRGMSARRSGDGPASWTVFMIVARPRCRPWSAWGSLPGVYEREHGDPRGSRMGGKPLGVMRAIVRDYSRPGELVCDPFAGLGTTLLAAMFEGRRAIGAEVDPDAHSEATSRLAECPTIPGRDGTLALFGIGGTS